MSLRYPVKVNRVNNLSDARYCAGMGVEILGISNEISAQEYIAITGWVTGLDICLDIYKNVDNVVDLVNELKPTYVETASIEHLVKLKESGIKTIYRIEGGNYDSILEKSNIVNSNASYVNISNAQLSEDQLIDLCSKFNVILDVDGYSTPKIEELCNSVAPAYIALNGGHEMAPGLKSFDEMAEVLEYLESTED